MSRPSPLIVIAAVSIAIAIIGGMFWANSLFARSQPGGQDFAVYWASARSLLEFQASPYGALAAEAAQEALGLGADPAQPGFRLDLPLYAEMVVFPFAAISDFPVARAAWMLLLEAALIATGIACLGLLGPVPRFSLYLLPIFAVFWVHAIWPLRDGNAIILAALCASLGLFALRRERDEAAGIFLALATFKFLTVGLFLLFVILWTLTRRRWRVGFAYVMSLVILVVLSFFFAPNWFDPYLQATVINLRVPGLLSTGEIISGSFPALGIRLSQILAGLTALLLLWEWWLARGRDYRHMLWVALLTLCLTPFLGLPTDPENYAVLILPVAAIVLLVEERWRGGGRWFVVGFLAFLFLILWSIYFRAADPAVALFFSAPILITVVLYWVRWWALRPPRTPVDSVRA